MACEARAITTLAPHKQRPLHLTDLNSVCRDTEEVQITAPPQISLRTMLSNLHCSSLAWHLTTAPAAAP